MEQQLSPAAIDEPAARGAVAAPPGVVARTVHGLNRYLREVGALLWKDLLI